MARTDLEQLVYQMSVDLATLGKQQSKALVMVKGSNRGVENEYAASGRRAAQRFSANANLGKALDNVFSRSRQSIFDQGAKRVGVLGGALEALGPAGLAAAAGMGAAALALNRAHAAMEMADEIADTATQLGVTTDLLQEYRYAARLAGSETKDADKAIQGFTQALGLAGNGAARQLKVFKALGFSQVDLRSFGSAEQGLQAVADKIAALDSEADRQAFASKLGLTPLLPLLRQGADGIGRLRQEARDLGVVMSEEVITKAADAKDKLETMSQVVSAQLTVAFADLAPYIADAAGALADLLKLLPAGIRMASRFGELMGSVATGYAKGGMIGASAAALRTAQRQQDFQFVTPEEMADALANGIPRQGPRPRTGGGGGGGGGNGLASGGGGKTAKERDLDGFKSADELSMARALDELLDAFWRNRDNMEREAPNLAGFNAGLPDGAQAISDMIDSDRQRIEYALSDAISGGLWAGFEDGLPGVLEYLGFSLQRTLIDNLAAGLTSALTSGGTSGVAGFLGKLFGGGRAVGGPVAPGRAYPVNENTARSEWFVPSVPGAILPRAPGDSASGARSGPTILNVTVHAQGAIHKAEIEGMVMRGSQMAVQAARGVVSTDIARRQRNTLGR